MNGLVGVGALLRVANGPARVSGRVARLRHKAETTELKDFIFGFNQLMLSVQVECEVKELRRVKACYILKNGAWMDRRHISMPPALVYNLLVLGDLIQLSLLYCSG